MRALALGRNAAGEPIRLTPEERAAHVHVIGASGSGKSKFLEWLIRADLQSHQGFCLIDPHGTLYRDVLYYSAHKVLDRDIILLDLSQPERVIGFNPFQRRTAGDISVQVDRRISATLHAWGVENSDETPTLERVLRLIYSVLIEKQLPFYAAQFLIDFNAKDLRNSLIEELESTLIRNEWKELQELRAKDWRAEVLSAKNRLFRLLTSKTLLWFLTCETPSIDLANIIEEGKVLLVNLAPSDHLSAENARVFGALLINEFFEVARRRVAEPGRHLTPYHLYLDEFHTFLGLGVVSLLDQVRKFGLFAVLAHQRFAQLDDEVTDAVLTNCRIKAVFGGLPVESARLIAQELFISDLDPKRIKVAIYQTKFWPEYRRDAVYATNTSSGNSRGRGANYAASSSSARMEGRFFEAVEWFLVPPDETGSSMVTTSGSSTVAGHHSSETDFSGEGSGTADIPIFFPVPFQELSSVQFYSPEEQLLELTAALKEQFERHCFIKIHHQKTQPMLVPFVRAFHTNTENLSWYRKEMFKRSGAISSTQADQKMKEQLSHFAAVTEQENSSTRTNKSSWSDILGKE